MEIMLNRRGGVPVRDQLVTQLEMKILSGHLRPGQKLPSVRALARQLKVHPNTISAAYQDLQAVGLVTLRRGSGVFALAPGPSALQEARGLDEMIRMALRVALARGFSVTEIRAAAERWLAAAPPGRVVVVDPVREMGEILYDEIKEGLGLPVELYDIETVTRSPEKVDGALVLSLPYHVEHLRQIFPSATCETVTLEVSAEDTASALKLPAGAIVLVVAHSQTILPFASVFLKSLRGDEILVEARHISEAQAWKRLCRAADMVYADVCAAPLVARAHPRQLRELRLINASALARLRDALFFVVPKIAPATAEAR